MFILIINGISYVAHEVEGKMDISIKARHVSFRTNYCAYQNSNMP
jgi:methylmalonyl-CoA mutase N-terminal domain/subunit